MDSFELIIGIVVLGMGIVYLYMGMSGKWVFLKRAADESTEEKKEEKTQQVRGRYRIIGVIGIVVGITAVLLSTIWGS
jgi:amino acid transporter